MTDGDNRSVAKARVNNIGARYYIRKTTATTPNAIVSIVDYRAEITPLPEIPPLYYPLVEGQEYRLMPFFKNRLVGRLGSGVLASASFYCLMLHRANFTRVCPSVCLSHAGILSSNFLTVE